jgi:nucleotide-binding universal stress UspA family protein
MRATRRAAGFDDERREASMKRVLVPIDGSDCSLRAVGYMADAVAAGLRPEIHLVNVQPALPSGIGRFVPRDSVVDFHREHSAEALRPAAERLAGAGIAFTSHEEVGPVAERIADLAARLACDHIVMGTHGRGALTEVLVGSTTLKVLHQTALPVILVK